MLTLQILCIIQYTKGTAKFCGSVNNLSYNFQLFTKRTILSKELGAVSIKICTVPKFYFILNEILQPYVGFRTVLFSSLSLPVFLSLMVKLCVILAKY